DGSVSPRRAIHGGGGDDGAAELGTANPARPFKTQLTILNFLGQHRGSTFCTECIAAKLFPGQTIDVAMRTLEGNGLRRLHGPCSACGKARLVASLPSTN